MPEGKKKQQMDDMGYVEASTPSATVVANERTVWDKRPVKYSNVLVQVCLFILCMELAERLSYYGINQGLKNFMHKLGMSGVTSNSIKSTWTSLCYLSPLMGAYIADEKWGRFRTILFFGIWYVIGDFLVALAAHPDVLNEGGDQTFAKVVFLFGLFGGIAVGTGAIKSSVVTFGADQFDPNSPKEESQKQLYFSTFYWCINLGATFSYGYLTTLSAQGSGAISKEYGYFVTFLLCAIVMVLALGLLVLGKSRYVHLPPSDSALSQLFIILYKSSGLVMGARMIVLGFISFVLSFIFNMIAAFTEDTAREIFTYIAGGLALIGIVTWVVFGMNPSFMEAVKLSNGGIFEDQKVNDTSRVIRILPFAAFQVMWQCCYDQIDANFQSITQQCDLRITNDGPSADQVPGAMLGVFGTISIVVTIPILDYAIYPLYTFFSKKKPSSFGKVFAGLCVATGTMFWAAAFEIIRRDSGVLTYSNGTHVLPITEDANGMPMNKLYWATAIPNYVLVGVAECLINITALEVFYSEVPESVKSTCQAVNLFMVAMGANVTSIFTLLFEKDIPDNLNEGNLENMYYAVGVTSILNLAAYTIVMWKMQFGMHKEEDETAQPKLSEKLSARASAI